MTNSFQNITILVDILGRFGENPEKWHLIWAISKSICRREILLTPPRSAFKAARVDYNIIKIRET